MQLQGWGRFPDITANIIEPVSPESAQQLFKSRQGKPSTIPRGMGRSYGDSALAAEVISSRFLDGFISLDEESHSIRCGSGVTMEDILKVAIPRGYFIHVLPGTQYVSLGGAIAADIHGKNHHKVGSFCRYVSALDLMLANGEIKHCSATENPELFMATCGGMGLTGVIIDATISLKKVPSVSIKKKSIAAENLLECMDHIEKNDTIEYSVAWIDCLAKREKLGRSIVHLAEHCEEGFSQYNPRKNLSIPFSMPSIFLNNYSVSIFNTVLYNLLKRKNDFSIVNYKPYFFPLDRVRNWNRLYGTQGFLQYQFVIPLVSARQGVSEILKKVSESGKGPPLSVLKKFGEGNENYLSFPLNGYSLAMDFKNEKSLFPLLSELDEIVLAHGGRLYLAKDARMSEDVFKKSYVNWEKFQAIKSQVDPHNVFASLQSSRLGLT